MATYFSFKSEGCVLARIRVGKRIDGVIKEIINIKRVIPDLYLPEEYWNHYTSLTKDTARENYLKHKEKFHDTIKRLKLIRKKIDACGTDITSAKIDEIINSVNNADIIKELEEEAAEKEKKRA